MFREKGRERSINVWLPLMRPLLGIWPATQAGALTGNQTNDPLLQSGTQSTEPHQPGLCIFNLTDFAQMPFHNGCTNLSAHTWFYCEKP